MIALHHSDAIFRTAAENAADSVIRLHATGLVRGPVASRTVLVVEDEPLVRAFAIKSVRAFGYRAIAAETGDEALALLASNPPVDILFTDIVMPGDLCGWDLAVQARQMLPDLRVIYTSGYAAENLVACKQLPDRSIFLSKPYRLTELRQRLHEVMADPAPEQRLSA